MNFLISIVQFIDTQCKSPIALTFLAFGYVFDFIAKICEKLKISDIRGFKRAVKVEIADFGG